MRWVLFLFSLLMGFIALSILSLSRGAVHEAVAGTMAVAAAVLFSAACIVDAIVRHSRSVEAAHEQLIAAIEARGRAEQAAPEQRTPRPLAM